MSNYRITVFTPTYNRACLITQLYQSLQRQTFVDFEWLVIDDGSNDNTTELFSSIIHKNDKFAIRYIKTSNGGKHRATNIALDHSKGEIFFTVDSDDYLTDDALFKIDKWFNGIETQPQLIGIAANKGTSINPTNNFNFKHDFLDKSFLDMHSYKENGILVLGGERAIALYTDVFRKYKFPVYDNEKFMTEGVVYNRIAMDGHKVRFYNDIIWVYEYLDDGLTKHSNSLFLNNPQGYGLWLYEKAKFTKASYFEKMKMIYTFTCDLSNKYDSKFIAKCIHTRTFVIFIMKIIHKIKKVIR